MKVVVIGGSKCSDEYKIKVEKFINNNFKNKDIILYNGGTTGVMYASSKACYNLGLKTVGIIVDELSKDINEYNSEIIRLQHVYERVDYLIKNSDYIFVFDGDIGTFEELFCAWNYFYYHTDKKIYIVGEKIKSTINNMTNLNLIAKEKLKTIEYIDFSTTDFLM